MEQGHRKSVTLRSVSYTHLVAYCSEYHKGKAKNPKCNSPHIMDADLLMQPIAAVSYTHLASILVTNNLMDRMGVSLEQLRSDALENSPEIRPVVIMGMNEVMKEMMGPEVYEMFGIPDRQLLLLRSSYQGL